MREKKPTARLRFFMRTPHDYGAVRAVITCNKVRRFVSTTPLGFLKSEFEQLKSDGTLKDPESKSRNLRATSALLRYHREKILEISQRLVDEGKFAETSSRELQRMWNESLLLPIAEQARLKEEFWNE